jgi:hypothetical protein
MIPGRPYIEAAATYRAGRTHDPVNEELKKGLRSAMDAGLLEVSEASTTDSEFGAMMLDPTKRRMFVDAYMKN